MAIGSNVAIPVPEIRMPVLAARVLAAPAIAALACAALLLAGPARAGEPGAATTPGGWTDIGLPTASFGPPMRVRLGAIPTPDLAQPAHAVALGRTYDREAFTPYLTGSAAAPALPVATPFAPDPTMLSMPRLHPDPRPGVPIMAKGRE